MAKKIPSANIKITSVLNTILNNPSGVISNNSVLNTSGLSSSIKVTGGVFGAPARSLSPIYRVDLKEIAGTSVTLPITDIYSALDLAAIDFSRPISDIQLGQSDFTTIQFTKAHSDFVTASDSTVIVTQFNPSLVDTYLGIDAISFDVSKPLSDIQGGQEDLAAIHTTKAVSDTQDGQTDFTTISFNKFISDFVTTIDLAEIFDGSTYTLAKSLTDTYLGIDVISFNTSKVLADTQLGQDDLAAVQFTKVLFDTQVGQTDSISIFKFINRTIDDLVNTSDAIQQFTINKVLADTATALDLLEVFDGSTYSFNKSLSDTLDSLSDSLSRTVDYNRSFSDDQYVNEALALDFNKILSDEQYQSDALNLDFTKAISDIVDEPLDSLSRTVDYNRSFTDEGYANDILQSIDFNKVLSDSEFILDTLAVDFIKILADEAHVDDLSSVFDGSNFEFDKFYNDHQYLEDSFSRVVDYNPKLADAESPSDAQFKTFDKAGVADRTRNWFAEGPSYRGDEEYAVDYFEITFDPVGGWPEEYALIMGPTIDFNKAVFDSVNQSDSIVYVSQFVRTFEDSPTALEQKAIDLNKILAPDTAGKVEGPSFYGSIGYSPSYFADDYTELGRPIFDINKPFTETLTASDTFVNVIDFIRNITETMTVSDTSIIDYTFNKFETITVTDDLTQYTLNKALADSVTTIDLIDINDGSTYTLDKTFSEIITILNVPAITFQKGTIAETMTASDTQPTLLFGLHKQDSAGAADGGNPVDEEYYSIGYFPDTYIGDFIGGVVKSFIKSLADFVTVIDDATPSLEGFQLDPGFATPSDQSVYSFIKPLTETIAADEQKVFTLEKPLSESQMPLEGPSFTDSTGYAKSYAASLYTLKRRPIIDFTKVLDTILNPVADASSFVFERGVQSDSVTASEDISTFNFIKVVSDTATPVDLIGIFDGSLYTFVKSLADVQLITESKAFNFSKILPNDLANPIDSPAISFSKYLEDSVTTLDLIDINDGSLYTLDKVFADSVTITDDITQYTLNKALADSVTTPDLIDIFDGSLYSLNKALHTLSEVPTDHISFDNTLAKADTQSLSDDDTIQFIKALADTQNQQLGPAFYEEVEYAADYFDPTDGVMYTVLGRPIFDFIKALTDTQAQTDSTRFSLTKPLTDTQLGQTDSNVINFTKARQDSVEPTDDISTFNFTKVLGDTAVTLDLIDIFDGSTYTFSKIINDTQNIAENKAITLIKGPSSFTDTQSLSDDDTIQFIKARSDTASVGDGGNPVDEEYYAINYFPDTYIQDFIGGVVKTLDKSLADFVTVLDVAQAGITSFPMDPEFLSLSDFNTYSFIKVLTETPTVEETFAHSFTKPLSDSQMPLEGPSFTDSTGYAKTYVASLYTLKRRPVIDFTKVLDTVTNVPTDDSIFSFTKARADTQSVTDNDTINFTKARQDSVEPTDDITQYTLNKVLADVVTVPDLTSVTDGSTFSLSRAIFDTQSVTESKAITLVKGPSSFTDTQSLSDDDTVQFTKAVADSVTQPEDQITAKTFIKALADFVTVLDEANASIVNFPMDPEFPAALDANTIQFIKGLSDSQFTSETTVYSLTKPLSDSDKPVEGPAFYDENEYAPSFFADDYTELGRPTFDFTKATSDTQSLSDDDTIQFIKPRSDTITTSDDDTIQLIKAFADTATAVDLVGIFDGLNYAYNKTITDTASAPDSKALNLNKILPGLITGSLDVSLLGFLVDSTSITVDANLFTEYLNTDPAYAIDSNVKSFIKVLADSVTTLDLIDINDGSLYTLDKVFSDSVTATEDISTFNFIKALADSVTTLDLIGITDGSTYTFSKSLADIQSLSDDDTVQFIKATSDTQSLADHYEYALTKPLSDTDKPLEGPSYFDEAGYAPLFFADNYTELYTLIKNFTKVLTDTQSLSDNDTISFIKSRADTQSLSDNDTVQFTKARSDSVSPVDDITQYTLNKALADTATPIDLVGITDGSTFTLNAVLTTTSNAVVEHYTYSLIKPLTDTQLGQTDNDTIQFTKARSDTQSVTDDIAQYTINKVLKDTPTPVDDIQQFTVSKVLADTATALDLVGIADGSTYTFNKTLADATGTPSDSLSRTVQFARTITEVATSTAGTPVLNMQLAFADIVTVSDSFDYATTAPTLITPSDAPSADDSGSLRMSDYFQDLSYFEETYIGTERTFT